MLPALYEAIAPALPAAALLLSLLSLFVSLRNRTDQREALLLGKRTEIVTLIAQRQAKLGHLEFVLLQKSKLLGGQHGKAGDPEEVQRIRANLEEIRKQVKGCDFLLVKLRAAELANSHYFEKQLATASEFLVHVNEELEKERSALEELRKSLSQDGT